MRNNNSIYKGLNLRVIWNMQKFFNRIIMLLATTGLLLSSSQAFSIEEASQDRAIAQEKEIRESATTPDTGKHAKSRIIGFDLGMSGGYSSGVSVQNFYYKPFGNLYLKHKHLKFTVGMSRYQDYLITSGKGKFEHVNFTQPKIALSLYPIDMIELYGEYRFSTGDPSHYYRGHEGTAGFLLDVSPVTIDASINIKKTEYRFKSIDWLNTFTLLYSHVSNNGNVSNFYLIDMNNNKYLDDISASVNLSWYVTDTTSIDASYYYQHSFFGYPEDRYDLHSGRIGAYSDVWDYVSIYGGINLGFDSDKYLIAGGDLGITFNIFGYVTLSVTYMPGYYKFTRTYSSLDRFIGSYVYYFMDSSLVSSDNPYFQSSQAGKSFMNHSVSFIIAYKY